MSKDLKKVRKKVLEMSGRNDFQEERRTNAESRPTVSLEYSSTQQQGGQCGPVILSKENSLDAVEWVKK